MNEFLIYIIFLILLSYDNSRTVMKRVLLESFSSILFVILASFVYIFFVKIHAKDNLSAFIYGVLFGICSYTLIYIIEKAKFQYIENAREENATVNEEEDILSEEENEIESAQEVSKAEEETEERNVSVVAGKAEEAVSVVAGKAEEAVAVVAGKAEEAVAVVAGKAEEAVAVVAGKAEEAVKSEASKVEEKS
jgi:hypothetical protein